MSHRGALPYFIRQLTDEELHDKKALAKFIAEQPLLWELKDEISDPSIAFGAQEQGYHGYPRGFIASELCYRVDPKHRYLGEFLKQEICDPLGIEFYFGLPEQLEPRFAPIYPENPSKTEALLNGESFSDPQYDLTEGEIKFIRSLRDPNSAVYKFMNVCELKDLTGNVRKIREVEIASVNGHTNSRSMAVLAGLCLENGTWDGKSIFKNPSTFQELNRTFDAYKVDNMLEDEIHFTQGGIEKRTNLTHNVIIYGWRGYGGSKITFVPELSLSLGYVMNQMGSKDTLYDPRPASLIDATLACAIKLSRK